MKKLVLKDKTELVFADTSTKLDLTTALNSYGDVDAIAEKITAENLRGAKFDGIDLLDVVPNHVVATTSGKKVEVHFINRELTENEILAEKIEEMQEIIATLV